MSKIKYGAKHTFKLKVTLLHKPPFDTSKTSLLLLDEELLFALKILL
jgi:hypothetical protein